MTTSEIIKSLKDRGIRIKRSDGPHSSIQLQAPGVIGNVEMVSTEKQKLLHFIENALVYIANATIQPVIEKPDYPVAYAQRRLLIINDSLHSSTAYNVPILRVFYQELDPGRFALAFQKLVDRHESLRTIFSFRDGEYKQTVLPQLEMDQVFQCIYLQNNTEASYIAQMVIDTAANKVFDLYSGPLISAKLICLETNHWLFFVNIHHIICDGWSINILTSELALLYDAEINNKKNVLPALPLQYRDYASWEFTQVNSPAINVHKNYWHEKFSGEIHTINFPVIDNAIEPTLGGLYNFTISKEMTVLLTKMSGEKKCSLFAVLLMLFKVLITRYTMESDITIGSVLADRNESKFQGVIGFFIKTLAFRTQLSETDSFSKALDKVNQTILEGFEHQLYPFDVLADNLNLEKIAGDNLLFNIMLVLQNPEQSPGLPATSNNTEGVETEAKFDLLLNMQETQFGLNATIEYRKNKFELTGIESIATHFINLATAFIHNPDEEIYNVNFLGRNDIESILQKFNATSHPYEKSQNIVSLFYKQVEKTPDKIAVVCKENHITYRQLFASSCQLANFLSGDCGVRAGNTVAFMAERNIQMIINMIAILTTGAHYVPIDPQYPEVRKEYILSNSNAGLLLISGNIDSWQPKTKVSIINVDEQLNRIQQQAGVYPLMALESSAIAYLIYTSGSTGLPKGVAISHGNAVNLLQWASGFHNKQELSGMLASTSVCFDLSVYEIFLPLVNGGAVIVVRNILSLQDYHGSTPVTIINTVPSAINELLRLDAIPASVVTINLAGEPLSRDCVDKLYLLKNVASVNNLYGPSETTTYSTFEVVSREEDQQPSIGKPIANTYIYILDKNLQLVPVGIYGELYIAGAGVARGYYNKPDLTNARFLENPFLQGGIMYKTGDSGKWLPDGRIQLAGRQDDQVKIRGYRIELGEINNCIQKYDHIEESVVLTGTDSDNAKYIAAYIVSANGDHPDLVTDLKEYLEGLLPEYMIPELFVILKNMPRTPNGKVDKVRLLQISKTDEGRPNEENVFTGYEKEIADLWKEVLDGKNIKLHDNFFKIGGHSLKATRLIARIHHKMGVSLPLRKIFEHPTIAELATEVANIAQGAKPVEGIKLLQHQDYYELSHAQKRLWLMAQTREGLLAYNMPYMFHLRGALDYQVLQKVAFTIIERHEALRTSFPVIDGQPWMRIVPFSEIEFTPEFLDAYGSPSINMLMDEVHKQEVNRIFDLANGPNIFVKLLRVNPENHILYFSMHHISSDAWSIEILKDEAIKLYNVFIKQRKNPLKPLRIQYKDFAAWQNLLLQGDDLKEHREYWLRKFSNPASLLELPADKPSPSIKTFKGNRIVFSTK